MFDGLASRRKRDLLFVLGKRGRDELLGSNIITALRIEGKDIKLALRLFRGSWGSRVHAGGCHECCHLARINEQFVYHRVVIG